MLLQVTSSYFRLLQIATGYQRLLLLISGYYRLLQSDLSSRQVTTDETFTASYSLTIYKKCPCEEYLVRKPQNKRLVHEVAPEKILLHPLFGLIKNPFFPSASWRVRIKDVKCYCSSGYQKPCLINLFVDNLLVFACCSLLRTNYRPNKLLSKENIGSLCWINNQNKVKRTIS